MSAALLLASTFALVFCLGLQSQLVNNQHYIAAFLNSLAIGTCNLVLLKLAPNETTGARSSLAALCAWAQERAMQGDQS